MTTERPMRIAYLSASDQLGGAERALLEIVEGVRRARPSWRLRIVLPGSGPLLDRCRDRGIDAVVVAMPAALARVGESTLDRRAGDAGEAPRGGIAGRAGLACRLGAAAPLLPLYERRLHSALHAFGPAIVHTNGIKAHVLGARTCVPSALVWHLHDYIGWRPLTRALLARYAPSTTSIVANSRSVAADAAEVLGPHRPIRAIHNAVDLRAFHPDGPRVDLDESSHLPRAAPGVVRVGLVGVFSRWKGHDVFLRALAGIPPHLPVRGYVVGDSLHATAGSQTTQEVLGRRAAALGLGGRVGFTGFLPPADAMRSLDVVVHASTRPEPFGMVIAEAMACGRPVITTGSGGAGEIVEPERDAVVSAAGDPDALARAIVRLACDASLRERLGRAARASARRRFDPERLTGDVLELYERFEEHRSAAVRRPVA